MKKNEIRAFKISGEAISELMWELLQKSAEDLLDLGENEETIYSMDWNKEKDELVFYALEFADPRPVDFDGIARYVDEHIGITTNSLFDPDVKPYRIFSLEDVSK